MSQSQTGAMNLVEEAPFRWRIDPVGQMCVPGIMFASRSLLPDVISDRSLHQVADVATLPGIVEASYAMPDVHWGYGFPIGGVAATDVARGGVVSPGGVGFDISCGVRLLISPLRATELDDRLPTLMDELDRCIPRGMGPCGIWQLRDEKELSMLLDRSDYVRTMLEAMPRYGIEVPDPQLACAPVRSPEGEAYLAAMAAAANYGRANRQMLTVATRKAFASAVGTDRLELLYDVSHNLAKVEPRIVDQERRVLCVHRKGATRALPPGDPELPTALRAEGQPVLIPGSMGTASHVLAGVPEGGAFHSTCHGAGRTMSRHVATRKIRGRDLRAQLGAQGIEVRAHSDRGLAEEAPFSCKDVDEVVATCERAGLARRVARLRPVGVVKG